MKPAGWPSLYQPRCCPMYVAIKAPAMPRRMVRINPPGSLPGMSNLAMAPTTKPTTIVHKRCIRPPLKRFYRISLCSKAIPDHCVRVAFFCATVFCIIFMGFSPLSKALRPPSFPLPLTVFRPGFDGMTRLTPERPDDPWSYSHILRNQFSLAFFST
jgi:hypothetical protein